MLLKFFYLSLFSIILFGCGDRSAIVCVPSESSATYELVFNATWSAETHPENIPDNPHFSGLIGATHQSSFVLWEPGKFSSLGIQRMAEQGMKEPLAEEIEFGIKAGSAEYLISGDGISASPDQVSVTFNINSSFPLVSLTSMIAPSPDWFVGVRDLALCENDAWLSEKEVSLFAYDAGTDSGAVFNAENLVTAPQSVISRLRGGDFEVPFGSFRFTRQ